MKKYCFNLVIPILLCITFNSVTASPAFPWPIEFVQPDSSVLTISLKGDENLHWAVTTDNYTVLLNRDGFYEYARKNDNNFLELSGIRAHNPGKRPEHETAFVYQLQKDLRFSNQQVPVLKSTSNMNDTALPVQKAFPTNGNRKLVCILVEYSDIHFVKTQTAFDSLFNVTGYSADGAAGCVKDYYYENSYGQLTLTVDVVGPFVLTNNRAYYGANDASGNDLRGDEMASESFQLADAAVNYANYDNDNDGAVDGVYIIYAGHGEESGAPDEAIWAHASYVSPRLTLDGKSVYRYSCSPELRGSFSTNITRIGVICHEFGHTLGANDFYDVDGEGSGGEFTGTGQWDAMANGMWNGNGTRPAHHNAYTKTVRYNWAPVTTLATGETVTLQNAEEYTNSFYRINTAVSNEYFLLENRTQTGFDGGIPGQGLLIYHVNANIGSYDINVGHPQLFYPVCASAVADPSSTPSSYGSINLAGCPFPGSSNKTAFTDATLPSSRSWNGSNTGKPITNIGYDAAAHTIAFDFMVDDPKQFTAETFSLSQIDLSWIKNGNRDVLLAWSPDGIFGSPVQGVNYAAGNSLPGGGTILYAGSNTAFNHTSLITYTTYYYKIWTKVNTIPDWTEGKTASAETDICPAITSLPFSEEFTSSSLPDCWKIVDHVGNGQVWQFGTFSGGMNDASGNYAFVNSEAFGASGDQNTELITPKMDLSAFDYICLSFKYYFRYSPGSSAGFAYSVNNGSTWQNVVDWAATSDNPSYYKAYLWEPGGKSQVRLKWYYTGMNDYYVCIDDIKIENIPATVDFTASSTMVNVNDTVTFEDVSENPVFTNWNWNFGDYAEPGATASGPGPHKVVYTHEGLKTVTMLVENLFTETRTNYITVLPEGVSRKEHTSDNPLEDITIYPVPAQDKLHIELTGFRGNVCATVMDVLGNSVRTETMYGIANSTHTEMIIGDLTPGIYFLRISTSGKIYTKKFVVE